MIAARIILSLVCLHGVGAVDDFDRDEQLPAEAVPRLSQEQVLRLVERLGSDDYDERVAAHQTLESIGKYIVPLLDELPKISDPEILWRLNSIRRSVQRDPLVGSQWYMVCPGNKVSLKPKTIELQEGGKFTVVKGTNTNADDETWEMAKEETIVLHFNNKYATYTGMWVDRDTLKGTAHNIKGKSWEWTATRVRP